MNTLAIKTTIIFFIIFVIDVLSFEYYESEKIKIGDIKIEGKIVGSYEIPKDVIRVEKRKSGDPIHAYFESGYCERTWDHIHGDIVETTYDKEGVIEIVKNFRKYKGPHELDTEGYGRERIVMIYNKKDSLLFFRHYTWEKGMLIQTVDGDTVRNIVSDKTPCDLVVIESFGDTTFLHLDPKEKVKNSKHGKYDAIINAWLPLCKEYSYTQELNASSSSSLNAKNKPDTSSYKYYIIILVCIIIVSIVIVYKKRRNKENRIRDEYPFY